MRNLKSWAFAATCLIYIVIMLGAYTRLKDAGLGCPDWPGCYGALLAPTDSTATIDAAKAWIEMIHRYVAGSLGLLILYITIQAVRFRKTAPQVLIVACTALGLVVFQALLGMWTVTLRLYPVVVMGHLLGGFAIFATMWWLFLLLLNKPLTWQSSISLRLFALLCLIVLCIQIALGGWTSANYAAVVCSDFPQCQGSLWPTMDFRSAFNFSAVGIFDSPGVALENTARVTIQMAHRIGALIATLLLSVLCYVLARKAQQHMRRISFLIFVTLLLQITLGITNVLAGLPLFVSLAHNAIAALLLLLLVTVNFYLNVKPRHIR